LKEEYSKFLNENFNRADLSKPLFYSWEYGLRFDLQVGETNTDEYFKHVSERAIALFNAAFESEDKILFVLKDFKYKRGKIRSNSYCFRQITNLKRQDVSYALSRRVYDNVKDDKWNIAIVKLEPKRLKVENLLAAIAHTDFPHRQPTLDNNGVLSNKELYFINLEKKLIFNMYDDRGLDIIAKDIETLRPIFNRFSDWILDYDREEINEKMKNGL
jgi:hypothetical protein